MATIPLAPLSPRVPCDYSAVTRSRTHRWTTEHKTVLCVLARFYDVTWAEMTAIFNAFFREQLPSSKGLSKAAITSMYYQLRKDKHESSGQWITLRTAIESQAKELGILLKSRAVPQEITFNQTLDNYGKPVDKPLDCEAVSSEKQEPRLDKPNLAPPSDAARNKHLCNKPIPRLAFRAYSSESQGVNTDHFVAGSFVGWKLIPEPPSAWSLRYRNHAARHIGRHHTGVTPFISVSINLIRCIHHATKRCVSIRLSLLPLERKMLTHSFSQVRVLPA